RTLSPRTSASGWRYRSTQSPPVGYAVPSGRTQPVEASSFSAAGSVTSAQGENRRTWAHSRTAVAADWPASSTRGSAPRSTRCATAARPTGPAPMTTTGCWWSVVDTLVLDTATTLPFASTSVDPLRDQDGTCFDERQHRHLSKP